MSLIFIKNSLNGRFLKEIKQANVIEIEYRKFSSLKKILYKNKNVNIGNNIIDIKTIKFNPSKL